MTVLPTALDEWALLTLDATAEHYAARYGDTPEVARARRAALLADLRQWQAGRGRSYRDGRKGQAAATGGAA